MKPNSTSYSELLTYLYQLKRQKSSNQERNLEPVKLVSEALGSSHKTFKSVHVAGSNGKGSVCTKIAKAIEHDNLKCGLYTSPHLFCFRERIQIADRKISEEDVIRLAHLILETAKTLKVELAFFDITTLIAFLWFAEEKVDWAVIEVGLGGRLDATNIILPEAAVITSISLEHTEILGSTLEMITAEKAGIFKKGTKCFIGPSVNYQGAAIKIEGSFKNYDDENSAIASKLLVTLGFSENSIRKGISIRPRFRAEWVCPNVLLDVAHNPDGIDHLINFIDHRKAHFCLGFSKGKDVLTSLKAILPHALTLTFTDSDEIEGIELISAQELKDMALSLGFQGRIACYHSPYKAAEQVIQHKELVVITGSFYIMSDVNKCLKNNF